MEESMCFNIATVKHLCSTDEIQGEKWEPFHFLPLYTIFFYTNYLLIVDANNDGKWCC